jgi:hypothetical protein
MVNVFDVALGGPSVQGEQPEQPEQQKQRERKQRQQPKQKERLMALAKQVAVESNPGKFHALILELHHVLNETVIPVPASGKPLPLPPAK